MTPTLPKKRMKLEKPGKIVIISSPSGGGKTSICRRVLSPARKRAGWSFAISYTTRSRRAGERNGREYFFVSEKEFLNKKRSGFFAESFKVHLYHYGTPQGDIEKVEKKGGLLLLDVDVQGAARIVKKYRRAITIFVLPPSVSQLKNRLRARGTETKEQLNVRYKNAIREMKLYKRFNYTVINRDLKTAVKEVLAIIGSHHCRTENLDREQIAKIQG